MIHGIFFISSFFMPMTGILNNMSTGETSHRGAAALDLWCVCFFPSEYRAIGILENGNKQTLSKARSCHNAFIYDRIWFKHFNKIRGKNAAQTVSAGKGF